MTETPAFTLPEIITEDLARMAEASLMRFGDQFYARALSALSADLTALAGMSHAEADEACRAYHAALMRSTRLSSRASSPFAPDEASAELARAVWHARELAEEIVRSVTGLPESEPGARLVP